MEMFNPRVRLKVGDTLLMDIGLWDLVMLNIMRSDLRIKDLEDLDLYLDNQIVIKPWYKEELCQRSKQAGV